LFATPENKTVKNYGVKSIELFAFKFSGIKTIGTETRKTAATIENRYKWLYYRMHIRN
jgi:hypothetical protein